MKWISLSTLLIAGTIAFEFVAPPAFAKTVKTNVIVIKTNAPVSYLQVNLVSNESTNAPRTDDRLVNAWGLIAGPGLIWVNSADHGLTLTYRPTGGMFKPDIKVPAPDGTNSGSPTGLIMNNTLQFVITNGMKFGPASLLMATEEGTIAGWNRFVSGSKAIIGADRSASNAIYKGLAIAQLADGTPQLYAANFHGAMIDVFDGQFQYVQSFTDTNLPFGFAPFNIRNIRGNLFVTFARQIFPEMKDDEHGAGLGYVDVFSPDGTLIKTLVSQGALNAPWGLALAPQKFGQFSGALLVGNFGDGLINAYDPSSGNLLGHLTAPDGTDVQIDGLWGLDFWVGPRLYFTAGPNEEADGLLGYIKVVRPPKHNQSNSSTNSP